jgi:adenylate kinase
MVRSDDQPDAIRNRLESFRAETAPVVDFYENLGLLRRVDSSRDPEQVYQDILTSIK